MAFPTRGYIPVFFDWTEKTEPLSDEEKGRLIDAMIAYARDGELVDMPGGERIAFPFFRERIDNARRDYENKVKAGRSKREQNRAESSKQEQEGTEQNITEQGQSETNKEEQIEAENNRIGNNKELNNNNNNESGIIIIINAWKDCKGAEVTEAEKKVLESWVLKYGSEVVLKKIEATTLCAKEKTLSYLGASLENDAKGVRKGKRGPETPEEKENRERAEEIEAWERQCYEWLDERRR